MSEHPFNGQQLQGIRYERADMFEANFDSVNLANAQFYAVLTNANLSNLSITNVTLAHTDIQNADLTGMRINGVLVTDLFLAYERQQNGQS